MKKNVFKNIIVLYGFSIAKIVLPLITLPYLTRILSVDSYGVVSYVKAIATYMQLIVDFGFLLSGTKDIVAVRDDADAVSRESGNIFLARLLLSAAAFAILVVLTFALPILRSNRLYTLLAFVPVFCTVFLFDYVFRGLEKMQVITERFVLMKSISTALTFVFVKGDADILWIPLLDIIGSAAAVIWVAFELKKLGIRIKPSGLAEALHKLKESAVYFLSTMATTAFNAFNTVLIGIFLSEGDVAFWSLCMQMVAAVEALYGPIVDGVYPDMVKTREIGQLKRLLKIFMPIVMAGCIFTFAAAKYILLVIGGEKYCDAAFLLRLLVPVLFLDLPVMLFGWPALGSIGRAKEVTTATVTSALFQVTGLLLLVVFNSFTLRSIAILSGITELVMLLIRLSYCYRFRTDFAYD